MVAVAGVLVIVLGMEMGGKKSSAPVAVEAKLRGKEGCSNRRGMSGFGKVVDVSVVVAAVVAVVAMWMVAVAGVLVMV